MFRNHVSALALALMVIPLATACNPSDGPGAITQGSVPPDTTHRDPGNPPVNRSYATQVMIFNGSGVSTSDWQSTESIVKGQGLSYQLVDSSQLNSMTLDDIGNFGMIIVPGGSGGTIARGLTTDTRLRLRQAVQDRGVSYLGFCAGAWVAVGPEANTDQVASYGFALADGDVLSLFLPGGQDPTAAIVPVTFADGSVRDLVWWGGPITPNWSHGVIAKYDTGAPAISESFSGDGLVIVSGPHPEAPQGWRATAGNDPDGLDYDLAVQLIRAALNHEPLPAY